MEGTKSKLIVPILVMVMLIFSSLITLGGGANGKEIKNSAMADYRQILFIYDNTTLAGEWMDYLDGLGYHMVNFLPYNMTRNVEYEDYALIIIGTDSHAVNPVDLKIMLRSHIPILGAGYGGIYAYASMGYPANYAIYSTNQLVVKKNLSVYNTPHQIAGVPGTLTLFDNSASRMYLGRKSSLNDNQSLCMGFYYNNLDYAPIIQIKNFVLFGYTQSPAHLTSDGDNLLSNLIHYTYYYYAMNVPITKAQYKITTDGTPYISEWYPSMKVPVEHYSYVSMVEDPDYLYIWIHMTNSTYSNDFVDVWFERDNNRTVGIDTSVFYIVFEEYYGLSYREANGYNSWSSFKRFDGINFAGNATYTSSHMDAEIRVSKHYLGIARGSNNIMGFGVMYQLNGVIGAYPNTFSWQDAQTAITTYSEYNWNGELNYLNSKRWASINVDGLYNGDEWLGASHYPLKMYEDGNPYQINVCHDSNNLYIGGYIPNATGSYSSIYLYFDTNGDGGAAPHTDDFEIWGGKSSSGTFTVSEHYGTGTGWGTVQTLTNADMKFKMRATSVHFELRISFSKLGITPDSYKEIRMQIALNIAGAVNRIPRDAQHTVPDTWNLVLYSQALWDTDQMTMDAREGYSVNVDGDLYEWSDSSFFYKAPTPMGKHITVLVKHDAEHLIIGLRYIKPNDAGNTNLQLGFDVGHNGGSPETRDFVIMIYHQGSAREFQGDPSTGWWSEVAPSGWNYAMDNSSTTGWTVEIAIEYSKLGITSEMPLQIGFILYMYEDSVGYSLFPVGGMFGDLSTWNTITSSDNWGEEVIPEFGTLGVIILGTVVAAMVIMKRRKT